MSEISDSTASRTWPDRNQRGRAMFTCAAFFLAFVVYLLHTASQIELNHPPDPNGDQHDYEMIAFNLWQGRGFATSFSHAEYFEPYRNWNQTGEYDRLLSWYRPEGTASPTAYRPPAFPFLIASGYHVFGRRFDFVRIGNCAAMAAAVALMVYLALNWGGYGVGFLTCFWATADPRLRLFSGVFLTESLACLSLSLLALALYNYWNKPGLRTAVVAGMCLGLAVLVRSIFVLWLPPIAIIVVVETVRLLRRSTASSNRGGLWGVAIIVVACLVALPWWIRNCVVLESFAPTGTQGPIGLVDGFSDSAVSLRGEWSSQVADSIRKELLQDPRAEQYDDLQIQKEQARRCGIRVKEWILANPDKLLGLSWGKLCNTWYNPFLAHWAMLFFATLGAVTTLMWSGTRVILGLALLTSLSVVATYSSGERFLIPILPQIHLMAAFGQWACFAIVRSQASGFMVESGIAETMGTLVGQLFKLGSRRLK